MVDLVEEVGTRIVAGVVVAVADGVGFAEEGDEGGYECKELAMRCLRWGTGVAYGGGFGAEVAVATYGVAYDRANGAGEVDEGTVCGHGCWVLICLMLISGYVVCLNRGQRYYDFLYCASFF